jgi:hypothetical protein
MRVHLFDLDYKGNEYKVSKSTHTAFAREEANVGVPNGMEITRDEFINNTRYKKIIEMSIENGILDFDTEGTVIVEFNGNEGSNRKYFIPIHIYNNEFFIVTVFSSKHWVGFENVKERIYIDYHMPHLNKVEKKEKKLEKRENIKIHKEHGLTIIEEDFNYGKHRDY